MLLPDALADADGTEPGILVKANTSASRIK